MMLIRKPADIPSSEITPESVYLRRRELMKGAVALAGAALLPGGVSAAELKALSYRAAETAEDNPFYTSEAQTPFKDATSYNNFYDFGTTKDDPAQYAAALTTAPWSIEVEGEVGKPGRYHLEDLLKGMDIEERVYRLRCVEAWSMVKIGRAHV